MVPAPLKLITCLAWALLNQTIAPELPSQDAPVPFRCDKLSLDGKKHIVRCEGNVVVRYDNLLLCCTYFTAQADKQWRWQNMHCRDDVRAYMDGRWVWGDKAEYSSATRHLHVTGSPLLRQGATWFRGSELHIDLNSEEANLSHPRGVLDRSPATDAPPPVYQVLPKRCPLPAREPSSSQQANRPTDNLEADTDAF